MILDEPTSSLSDSEVTQLLELVRQLRAAGVAVIYISHRMDEIMEISDEISIMRDGHMIGTWPTSALTLDQIITTMVGRELTFRFPDRTHQPGDVLVEVCNLTSDDPHSFTDISFVVRRGEVLGIGGLVGAQRTELLEAIFGLRRVASGEVRIGGRPINLRSPRDAKRAGMALLTEDRRAKDTRRPGTLGHDVKESERTPSAESRNRSVAVSVEATLMQLATWQQRRLDQPGGDDAPSGSFLDPFGVTRRNG